MKKCFEVGLVQLLHIDVPFRHSAVPDSHLPKLVTLTLDLHFAMAFQHFLAELTVVFEQKPEFFLNRPKYTSSERSMFLKTQKRMLN